MPSEREPWSPVSSLTESSLSLGSVCPSVLSMVSVNTVLEGSQPRNLGVLLVSPSPDPTPSLSKSCCWCFSNSFHPDHVPRALTVTSLEESRAPWSPLSGLQSCPPAVHFTLAASIHGTGLSPLSRTHKMKYDFLTQQRIVQTLWTGHTNSLPNSPLCFVCFSVSFFSRVWEGKTNFSRHLPIRGSHVTLLWPIRCKWKST